MHKNKYQMNKKNCFEFSNSCAKHNRKVDYICTFPQCTEIEICYLCKDEHQTIHSDGYIMRRNQWLNQLKGNICEIQKETEQIKMCQKPIINQKTQLLVTIERVMKCLTDQRNKTERQIDVSIIQVSEDIQTKLRQKSNIIEYFWEIQEKKVLENMVFLMSEKGWVKLKKKLHEIYVLTTQYKDYLKTIETLFEELQKISHKRGSFLMSLNSLVEETSGKPLIKNRGRSHTIFSAENLRKLNNFN